nr:ASCH domain-containing protein [Paenibacillus tepidiphilus]
MRCITIRQPWATLIALGEKRFETRSWRTPYRGELAIHAGKKLDRASCAREPVRSVLAQHGLTADDLPLGAIIATCILSECTETLEVMAESDWPGGHESVFGDYTPGRFAWKLAEVVALKHPIAAQGRLGFWEYPVLEEEI